MANWRDIQEQAEKFVFDYRDAKDEDRDAKAFWKDLMMLYGVEARSIGAFEERVRIHGRPGVGKIDYFAPSKFLIEQKSRGKDLDVAYRQAMDYFDALDDDLKPRYIVVSDFAKIRVFDLESPAEEKMTEFVLEDLPRRVREFAFFTDEEVQHYKPEDPINVRAVRAVGKLYDAVRTTNHFTPDEASRLLSRLVFCFFADDTEIFNSNSFRHYIESNTKPDGSDIGAHIGAVFQALDIDDGTDKEDKRPTTMHLDLAALPYVNGGLFGADLKPIFGSREIRETLLECMRFDWSKISPEIFGSMFQSVLDQKDNGRTRHDLGAHYTSEENILKVINGLFLEDLTKELTAAKANHEKLRALWDKLAKITLLDPACGCGNFLVVAYRELRKIENEIIRRLHGKADKRAMANFETHVRLDLGEVKLDTISRLSIERMHGIEIEAFPAEVARLSLWVIDHMMNVELGAIFGRPHKKLPLREAPHIVPGNALRMDWESVVPKERLTYILGNPPFLGKKEQNDEQKEDMETVWLKEKGTGVLDYVTCWYKKAADLIEDTHIEVAFVSTNSITQEEQVGVLWPLLIARGIKIHFAHRTFRWSNEATGKAAVHCVIIGFAAFDVSDKFLFEYEDINGNPERLKVRNINPYLVDASDVVVTARKKPLSIVAPIASYGSFALDGGFLTLTPEERNQIVDECPESEKFLHEFIGGQELIHAEKRYCLWLADATPAEIRDCPSIARRVNAVRQWRSLRGRETTRGLAETPYLFAEIRQPSTDYIAFPTLSSENRKYIPIAILDSSIIASNQVYIIPTANKFFFGVLTSTMHNAWIRAVCGKLESRYRYSIAIVYNNFPWPLEPTGVQKKAVEDAAQSVLDTRAKYPDSTLADLYERNTMRPELLKAHHALDRAVDACYSKKSFKSEPERLEFLFGLYKGTSAKSA